MGAFYLGNGWEWGFAGMIIDSDYVVNSKNETVQTDFSVWHGDRFQESRDVSVVYAAVAAKRKKIPQAPKSSA